MSGSDDDRDFLNADVGWLETEAINGFKVWHIIAICLGILLILVVMVCCCIRFRIPRTKQEIEADYQRKQITKKFREKLQHIKNSDMDDMDLQKATDQCCLYNDNNNIYCDSTTYLTEDNDHHVAWHEYKNTIVSMSIVEAGYIALHHVTKELISQRTTTQRIGILKQIGFNNHIVYPATTYRSIKQQSPYLMSNPMIHRTPRYYDNSHKINDDQNNNHYHFDPNIHYDDNTFSNGLEDDHPNYGCNL